MNSTKFERYEFKPFIIEAVKELGFYEPTEIQTRMIPLVLKGESTIGQSQTGTGKTHSYILPILQKIDPERVGSPGCYMCSYKRTCRSNLSGNPKNYRTRRQRGRNYSTIVYWRNGQAADH